MKDTGGNKKDTSLLTSGLPVAFISMQRGLYLDMSSCTDANGGKSGLKLVLTNMFTRDQGPLLRLYRHAFATK